MEIRKGARSTWSAFSSFLPRSLSFSLSSCFPRCLSLPKSGSPHMAAFFSPPSVSLSLHSIPEVFISGRRWCNSDTQTRACAHTHTEWVKTTGWEKHQVFFVLLSAESNYGPPQRLQPHRTSHTKTSRSGWVGEVLNGLITGLDCVGGRWRQLNVIVEHTLKVAPSYFVFHSFLSFLDLGGLRRPTR